MVNNANIQKLEKARDDLAQVYKDEATDDVPDNGNLINIHKAILSIECAIQCLKKRR